MISMELPEGSGGRIHRHQLLNLSRQDLTGQGLMVKAFLGGWVEGRDWDFTYPLPCPI